MVGRIEPFKRQLEFLRAAERVIGTGREAGFFVVGAPNLYWPRYARRVGTFPAAHGIDRQVVLTGPRTDIDRVIASLDVLVTLSGGSVMLEAMACGIPVVTASDRRPAELEIVRDVALRRPSAPRDRRVASAEACRSDGRSARRDSYRHDRVET